MAEQKYKNTNHLINESSPYLLQHAHNPVNWYPWGEEALNRANEENKLILISIGYAACHWCHVMEEESFEDTEVAQFMNENFIAIKVDREERPDIDKIYMDAVQLITGQGGWPLNCIAQSDGRPIHGGTYFPKENWLDMLSHVVDFVNKNPDKAEEQAAAVTRGVQNRDAIFNTSNTSEFTINDLNEIFTVWEQRLDMVQGGQLGSPKFPMATGQQYLLHYNFLTENQTALDSVLTTLKSMADGGIYDQLGGGFSRYSTDNKWKVPHFEKMLYDNAQLVSLYSRAYQKTKNPYFKTIVEETLEFVDRELSSTTGGFYSSLDADSEGEEGKFYVWSYDELISLLGENQLKLLDYYNVRESGNWEKGANILFKSADSEVPENLSLIKELLLKERGKRIRPALDDKILTSWNALMIKAYSDAYRIFDDESYLTKALKGASFILKEIKDEKGRLDRNFKNGQSSINGFLDDYAFTIEAFISLYEATFDEKWLYLSEELTEYALTHFYSLENDMFFYTSDLDPELIARKIEIVDNVISSSNSQMAKNLYVLGHYFYNESYIEKSKRMINNVKESLLKGGQYFANWDILLAWFTGEPYEVAIVGDNYESIRKKFDQNYLPNVFLSGAAGEGSLQLLKYKKVEGQTMIYVCKDKACLKPVNTVEEAIDQILK